MPKSSCTFTAAVAVGKLVASLWRTWSIVKRGNQQAPDAAIAIQERVNRLKPQVDQRRFHQRRFGRNPLGEFGL